MNIELLMKKNHFKVQFYFIFSYFDKPQPLNIA